MLLAGILMLCLCSCSFVQRRMDISGLKDLAADITTGSPGSPEKLQAFVQTTTLAKDTEPVRDIRFTVSPLAKWPIEHPSGDKLIMEKITFPSLIEHQNGMDTAVFYVPPYHLERTEAGKKNGEGLLTPDHEKNISILLNAVRELRTMISYLKSNGVTKIGGWGGSIGATMLMLTAQTEEFDHLNMMIPIIDFNTVIFRNIHMRDAVARFEKAGFPESLLTEAYGIVNPVKYQLKIDPSRVQIMYAEYDQLTPEDAMIKFAQKNNIKKLIAYPRSHATMLLTRKIYGDYGLFLDMLNHAE